MHKIKSIICTFKADGQQWLLEQVKASLALSYPSDSLDERQGVTGTWVELLDASGELLYRRDIYAMIHAVSEDGFVPMHRFDVQLPYMPEAEAVRIFAPPLDQNQLYRVFTGESRCIGCFRLPEIALPKAADSPVLPKDICGKGKGQVLRMSQIKAVADVENVYNLVILAEKFGHDQGHFLDTAFRCINFLYSRPPFLSVAGADSMNVWLVETESNTREQPYFGSSYGSEGTHVDWVYDDVKTVCDSLFSKNGMPYWNWAGLIIDDDQADIGTRCGNQFAISTIDKWRNRNRPWLVFQHEFGHAAFNLADEYSKKGKEFEYYTEDEPNRPNVTTEHTIEKLKWRALVDPKTPVPTGDSYFEEHPEAVGCYEGGFCYQKGIYRPKYHCVMNNQREKDVNGYYCPVCLEAANVVLSRTLDARIPAPGVVFYSNSSQTWKQPVVASRITKKYDSLCQWEKFDQLVASMQRGEVDQTVKELMEKTAKIMLPEETRIVSTLENGEQGRGVWYLYMQKAGLVYYVITYRSSEKTEINTGRINVPPFLKASDFDGVTVGMEQHLFSISDGCLYYGVMNSRGELKIPFAEVGVAGLDHHVTTVSVVYHASRIWVAVTDGGRVKMCAYSMLSRTWETGGFTEMPETSAEDRFVKLFPEGQTLYVLVKKAEGLIIRTFDCRFMQWKQDSDIVVKNTEQVLLADFVYYRKCLWLCCQTVDGMDLLRYDCERQDACWLTRNENSAGVELLSALSCTMVNHILHAVYLEKEEPMHEMYRIAYKPETGKYEAEQIGRTKIACIDTAVLPISAMSLQNDGNRIYLILSTREDLSETE